MFNVMLIAYNVEYMYVLTCWKGWRTKALYADRVQNKSKIMKLPSSSSSFCGKCEKDGPQNGLQKL